MTKQNTNRILLIYNILLSASIFIAGVSLISGCLSIYYSGNGYSRELVIQTFSKICVAVYICLALVVGSFIINAIIPSSHKAKPVKHYNHILLNLKKTRDADSINDYIKIKKRKEVSNYVTVFVCAFMCYGFLTYALNSNNFHQSDINDSLVKAMCVLLPRLIVMFAFAIFNHYYSIFLTKKQIEILKTLPKKETKNDVVEIKPNDKKFLIAKIVIATVAVVVLIFGSVTGGFADVLTKAINICTECIGLG